LFFGKLMVRNVSSAEVYPFVPDQSSANGEAVLVVPGGGYQMVSMGNEGFPVAERLAKEGYSVFVLKYRTRQTPVSPEDFLAAAGETFYSLGKTRLKTFWPAVDDLAKATQWVRDNCATYACDGKSLHLIGASAGARTSIKALEEAKIDAGIESLGLIYPPMIDPVVVASEKPPLFLIIAQDDPLFQQGNFILPATWVREGGDLEFHLYQGGGHGFGTSRSGTTSENWLNAYVAWLKAGDFQQ
jgi:acetyl esterase/lipase